MAENNAGTPSQHIATGGSHAVTTNNSVPATAKAKAPAKASSQAPAEPKDSLREIVETIVFVVVLVLLLKSFVAEAFVIPTGSMAETLYGYQKDVKCPKCGLEFPVNCSCEVDPQQGELAKVIAGTCPTCRYYIDFAKENINRTWNTGDRVLVGKYFYDFKLGGLDMPKRYEVVVFKYPENPQKDYTPLNYIKRLIGLPGETIAIQYGKLYHYVGLNYDDEDRDVPKLELRKHMHDNDEKAIELLRKSQFTILRKPPKQVWAERRIVFDNDHQPSDLKGKFPPRWQAGPDGGAWKPNDKDEPKVFQHAARQGGEIAWLRYQHLVPPLKHPKHDNEDRSSVRRELITDIMGYNTWVPEPGKIQPHGIPSPNWVGDLMLDCNVEIQQAQGELVFELSKGVDRFRARWDLVSGRCTLSRWTDGIEQELDSKDTTLKMNGKYRVRFANVDERLLVWIGDALPFGEGVTYDPPRQRGPREQNDFEPASIGVKGGAVAVSGIKLWRDTYYTANLSGPDHGDRHVDLGNPAAWAPLRDLPEHTMYVQPGHFLCLGDNSPESSDSRAWGEVPQRLLLGRALMIYWPFVGRAGRIE